MKRPAPRAAAPLRAAVLAAALLAAAAQPGPAIRAVAASGGIAHSITSYGSAWSSLLGDAGWGDSGAFPPGVSALNYGTLASDGNGNGPVWQSSGSVLGICFAAAAPYQGWAVGNGGTLLRTRDGGATWAAQAAPVGSDLYAVSCVSATVAVAVGASGVIIRTADGGATWARVAVPSWNQPADLFCVSFSDATHGIACGLAGQILATADGGATWADVRPPAASGQRTQFTLTSCHAPAGGTAAYVGGTGGTVLATSNFQAGTGAAVAFTQVPVATSGIAAAAGDPTLANSYTAVTGITSAAAGGTVWFATTGGGIVALTGGASWSTQWPGAAGTPHLRAISAVDATHVYAVGNAGTVLLSSDGVTWQVDGGYAGAATSGVADIVTVVALRCGGARGAGGGAATHRAAQCGAPAAAACARCERERGAPAGRSGRGQVTGKGALALDPRTNRRRADCAWPPPAGAR